MSQIGTVKGIMNKLVANKFPLINTSPRIALVGEAPGVEEEACGVPFVGMAGKFLDAMLNTAGILRNGCFVGNVYQFRPLAGNDIDTINRVSIEWATSTQNLLKDLTVFKPDVIVALGEVALEWLTGKDSITKYRGSILPCIAGIECKVIGTIHPSAIMQYSYIMRNAVIADLRRAKEEAAFPDLHLPVRLYHTSPSLSAVLAFLSRCHSAPSIAFDFETTRGNGCIPLCLGIAISKDEAMCIDFGEQRSLEEEATIWFEINKLMRNPNVGKIVQNYLFDCSVFFHHLGIIPVNIKMDTMIAFHACYPEWPKRLSFMTSLLTRESYYKDEGKEDEDEKTSGEKLDRNKLYVYNCKDCCVTFECAIALETELDELGARKGYQIDMEALPIALGMTMLGMKMDFALNKLRHEEIEKEIVALDKIIETVYDHPVNTKSPKQMKEFLYVELGLPPQKSKTGALTTDADALINLARHARGHDIKLLLKNRQLRTKQSFFAVDGKGSPEISFSDGRCHSGFRVGGTETGRWSSNDSILGGRNLMNIPEDCRDIFVADPGKILVGWDKAQAEARVVAYKSFVCTDDPTYKNLVESGTKVHVWFGRTLAKRGVFPVAPEEVVSGTTWYYIAKVGVHAFSYGMGPEKFCRVVAKETDGDTIVEMKMARLIKETLYEELSAIPKWQSSIRDHLSKSRRISTTFGRARLFFERYGDDLFGKAYAYEPQSTVADDVATSILRVSEACPEADILQQNYDSMLVQVEEGIWQQTVEKMKPLISVPFKLKNFTGTREVELAVPVVFKVGKNWKDMEELK